MVTLLESGIGWPKLYTDILQVSGLQFSSLSKEEPPNGAFEFELCIYELPELLLRLSQKLKSFRGPF